MERKPPGQVKREDDSKLIMMICTAGHVDHGKTSLVKQLTGCNTDRLKAEKERGLTIELGFAPCMLRGGLSVGIVDVPGHEKFVKNMVSGVSGIDLAVLVIAADDGIMPQTIEHVQIMELLGIRSGIVALTKIDLVSEDRVNQLKGDIHTFLQGTFLTGAPICPVSSETFDGYFEFYDTLVDRIQNVARGRTFGIFRMPVERVFTQKGFGAILSGIPVDGSVKIGDPVELVPGNHKGKVRGIQRFAQNASEGGSGQCLALNIPDFGKVNPSRGQVLCTPGYLKTSRYFHLRVKTVIGMDKPIKNAEEIKFHTGTIEEPGRIFLLEEGVLGGGQTGLATVALSKPVAAAVLDRFVIRRPSPAFTIAGGEILAVSHSDRRPRKKRVAEWLKAYQAFFEGVAATSEEGAGKRIEYFLCAEQKTGSSLKEVSLGTLLRLEVVEQHLARLEEEKKVMVLGTTGGGQGAYYIHTDAYVASLEEVEDWIKAAFAREDALTLTVSRLRKRFEWPALLMNKILEDLARGALVTVRENKIVLKETEGKFDEAERKLMDTILETYEKTGYKSPRPDQLAEMLRAPQEKIDRMMEHLFNEMKLIRLTKNVVLAYPSFKRAQDVLVNKIKEDGAVNSADFKYLIDSTRKYALAFLDYMDSRRITVCLQNHDRKLAQDYEKNLL